MSVSVSVVCFYDVLTFDRMTHCHHLLAILLKCMFCHEARPDSRNHCS